MKAAVRRVLDIYFAISIILAFVSFSMVVIDGVNKMTSGRFKIFEILNLNDVDIYALSDDGKHTRDMNLHQNICMMRIRKMYLCGKM